MGLPTVLRCFNWPAVISGSLNIGASFSLVLLSKLCLTPLAFSFPATLALLHTSTIAFCLWFWTIFGMVKPRSIPLAHLLRHAIPTALSDVLAPVALESNSISIFHASRLAIAPTMVLMEEHLAAFRTRRRTASHADIDIRRVGVWPSGIAAFRRFQFDWKRLIPAAASCFFAASVIATDQTLTSRGCVLAIAALIAAASTNLGTLSVRQQINANELQFQLFSKSLSAVTIAILLPFVDDISPASPHSLLHYEFPESYTIHIFFSGLLAFLSFISMRTSATRCAPLFFTVQTLAVSSLAFIADRTLFIPHFAIPTMWLLSVAALILSTAIFSILRELNRSEGCMDLIDEEAAAIEIQRQQLEGYYISLTASQRSPRPQDVLTHRGQPIDHSDTHPVSRQPISTRQRSCRTTSQSPVTSPIGPVLLLRYASATV